MNRVLGVMSTRRGLTVAEVLIALALMGIVGAVFVTGVVTNLSQTTESGQRTQTAQVLNYFGRRVAGGDDIVLPSPGETLTWAYGELDSEFEDLRNSGGFADPANFSVQIHASGAVSSMGSSLIRYDIEVCGRLGAEESCMSGTTLSVPAGLPEDSPAPIPGIN